VTDGNLAVIGLGSAGSMALWQAAKLSGSSSGGVVGFEARTPAHSRSAVGGDSRLFRTTFREQHDLYPLLESSFRLWRELESDSGQEILNQCGGLSIGHSGYIGAILRNVRETGAPHTVLDATTLRARFPQHRVGDDDAAVFDPRAGFLRTDRAVLSAVAAAENHGAQVLTSTSVDTLHEDAHGVRVVSGSSSWTFDRVILAAGGWSRHLLPTPVAGAVTPHRIFLTWFPARDPASYTPDRFPIFIRIQDRLSMYGAPSLDGSTVKATLDGRGTPASTPHDVARELTDAEVAESELTIREFLPGLVPSIVRSDSYPDLYTTDRRPLIGTVPGRPRTLLATGLSGAGFKIASGVGSLIARRALGYGTHSGLEGTLQFADPGRFAAAALGQEPSHRLLVSPATGCSRVYSLYSALTSELTLDRTPTPRGENA
jgi:sarcosine oxidase